MNYYSPNTGELIETSVPSDWMGKTAIAPPQFDRAAQGCFFRDGAWVIVDAVKAENPRIEEIKAELVAIDMRRIRPLAEGDSDYLATLNAQAISLRAELASITN